MPILTVTIPNIKVDLDVPPDFAPYVTLEDIREMAEAILSVHHIGLGIDTVCRIRAKEKAPEWTPAYVHLDQDEKIDISLEEDGFTALEKTIAASTTGILSLTASYRKLGQQEELVSIMNEDTTEEQAAPAMRYFMKHLEGLWKAAP